MQRLFFDRQLERLLVWYWRHEGLAAWIVSMPVMLVLIALTALSLLEAIARTVFYRP